MNVQGLTLAQDHGVFDHIPQLPYVARPGIGLQGLHGLLRDAFYLFSHPLLKFIDNCMDQERNIFRTLTEGGNYNGKN